MSRGVLELLSHFRTETQLMKDHRIRLETPWLPLFDQNENELHGVGLQEAKRRARESHPIAPNWTVVVYLWARTGYRNSAQPRTRVRASSLKFAFWNTGYVIVGMLTFYLEIGKI